MARAYPVISDRVCPSFRSACRHNVRLPGDLIHYINYHASWWAGRLECKIPVGIFEAFRECRSTVAIKVETNNDDKESDSDKDSFMKLFQELSPPKKKEALSFAKKLLQRGRSTHFDWRWCQIDIREKRNRNPWTRFKQDIWTTRCNYETRRQIPRLIMIRAQLCPCVRSSVVGDCRCYNYFDIDLGDYSQT
jgi:hypothetical protein